MNEVVEFFAYPAPLIGHQTLYQLVTGGIDPIGFEASCWFGRVVDYRPRVIEHRSLRGKAVAIVPMPNFFPVILQALSDEEVGNFFLGETESGLIISELKMMS